MCERKNVGELRNGVIVQGVRSQREVGRVERPERSIRTCRLCDSVPHVPQRHDEGLEKEAVLRRRLLRKVHEDLEERDAVHANRGISGRQTRRQQRERTRPTRRPR
jgi:hypothetical protein